MFQLLQTNIFIPAFNKMTRFLRNTKLHIFVYRLTANVCYPFPNILPNDDHSLGYTVVCARCVSKEANR